MQEQATPQAPPSQVQEQSPPSHPPLADHDNGDLDSGLQAAAAQLTAESRAAKEGRGGAGAPEGARSEGPPSVVAEGGEGGEKSSSKPATEPIEDTKREPPTPKASQWANLNRREQELARKQQEFSKERAELEAASAAIKRGKTSTWEALKALGFENKKEFLEHIASTGGEATPEQQKIAELEAWKTAQEEQARAREAEAAEAAKLAEFNERVSAYKANIAQYTAANEKWKDALVAMPGNEAAVYQLIHDHYVAEREELPFDAALEQVNTSLEQELSKALETITGNPRGRAIVQELVAKSLPDAKRGKSVRAPGAGLTTSVTQHTPAEAREELSLDDAVARNAAWLESRVEARRR